MICSSINQIYLFANHKYLWYISEEDCEFEIITCDQKRWEFSATSVEERDEWVGAIEKLIEKSLQAQVSQKQQDSNRGHGNRAEVS